MANPRPEMPHTQTSAPVKPARTTQEPSAQPPARGDEEERSPARRGDTDERAVRGDRMPAGADEPGAGL